MMLKDEIQLFLFIFYFNLNTFECTKARTQKSNSTMNIKHSKKALSSSTSSYQNMSIKYVSTEVPSLRNLLPSSDNLRLNYCSFFNNRAPSPQVNLKNCTWYKENSCCLQSEIESTFSKVI